MYIDIVPNRNSKPAILLREAWREKGKIKKRTIMNLSDWPMAKVEALRVVLRGDYRAAGAKPELVIERSLPHGAAAAVLGMMKKLKFEEVIGAKRSRERDLVAAMIAERLLHPGSKLATARLWSADTLSDELGVNDADEDELYSAMDWLLERQKRIEGKLAARHLGEGRLVLYDATSSYYEGRTCPLAEWGHNRDGKKGKKIIVYGVLTDGAGCPVAVEVYKGNTGDPTTVPDQVAKLRERFGLDRVVLVGDRGMLAGTQLEVLREHAGLGWITALRSGAIRELADSGALQMSLFDERNLVEIANHPDYPGERLIVCRNPLLRDERARKREDLLRATAAALGKIAAAAGRRRKALGDDELGIKVGKVIDRWKMGKHFRVVIAAGRLEFARKEEAIAAEAALDGLYVIRTSEPEERLSAADAVRSYKKLSAVERLFRTLKGLDLKVRPIFHRDADRVRAHIFICLLAYYIEWHMRKALAPLLFDDEFPAKERDPVAPAQISAHAKAKKRRRQTSDGLPLHSFNSLLTELATLTRNRCRLGDSPAFTQLSEPTALQTRAFELLGVRCQ
jgi:transposase